MRWRFPRLTTFGWRRCPPICRWKVRPPQGWDGTGWQPAATWLTPVIGLVDRPRGERCQTPLALPLGKGHLAIYSAPGYGKTTAVRTLITSLALTHFAGERLTFTCSILAAGFKLFEGLPHTGAVITTDEMERQAFDHLPPTHP